METSKIPEQAVVQETPSPDDYLFDYGYGLRITHNDLGIIPTVDAPPSDAVFLGSVFNETTQRNIKIYKWGDNPVQYSPGDGIEG